jgi:hypothetical protein
LADAAPERQQPGTRGFTQRPASEPGFDLDEILKSVRETAYRLDFATDRMEFAENAVSVLGTGDAAALGKGRAFALMVDPEHAGARYDGMTGGADAAPRSEVRYSLHYRFLPQGRRGKKALWVEDTGVCTIDAEGTPQSRKAYCA